MNERDAVIFSKIYRTFGSAKKIPKGQIRSFGGQTISGKCIISYGISCLPDLPTESTVDVTITLIVSLSLFLQAIRTRPSRFQRPICRQLVKSVY